VLIATSAVAPDPVGAHLQRAQALQLTRPRAIASHHTAALAHDIPLPSTDAAAASTPAFIEPAGPTARSLDTPRLRLHVRDLPRAHRAQHPSGLLVTTITRTAVDVGAELTLPEVLIPVDGAVRALLIERHGTAGLQPGPVLARRTAALRTELRDAAVIAAPRSADAALLHAIDVTEPLRESPLESLSYGHFRLAGLPEPAFQVPIHTPIGTFFPDFLWREHRVIGEADGLSKYQVPDDLRREKVRQEALEEMGFLVVRWTWPQLTTNPGQVVARIRRALAQRAA
jgi:very-short-patch-repair endonuclease